MRTLRHLASSAIAAACLVPAGAAARSVPSDPAPVAAPNARRVPTDDARVGRHHARGRLGRRGKHLGVRRLCTAFAGQSRDPRRGSDRTDAWTGLVPIVGPSIAARFATQQNATDDDAGTLVAIDIATGLLQGAGLVMVVPAGVSFGPSL